jgi:hypothetical protein
VQWAGRAGQEPGAGGDRAAAYATCLQLQGG